MELKWNKTTITTTSAKTPMRQHQKHQPNGSFYILNCHWTHIIENCDRSYGSIVADEKTIKQKHYIICAVHAISIACNGRLFDTRFHTHSLTRYMICSPHTNIKYREGFRILIGARPLTLLTIVILI